MSSEATIYTDAYGTITQEQYDLYREFNVSPADHDTLVDVYGGGDSGRASILSAVREFSRDGMYQEFHMVAAAQRRGAI